MNVPGISDIPPNKLSKPWCNMHVEIATQKIFSIFPGISDSKSIVFQVYWTSLLQKWYSGIILRLLIQ